MRVQICLLLSTRLAQGRAPTALLLSNAMVPADIVFCKPPLRTKSISLQFSQLRDLGARSESRMELNRRDPVIQEVHSEYVTGCRGKEESHDAADMQSSTEHRRVSSILQTKPNKAESGTAEAPLGFEIIRFSHLELLK